MPTMAAHPGPRARRVAPAATVAGGGGPPALVPDGGGTAAGTAPAANRAITGTASRKAAARMGLIRASAATVTVAPTATGGLAPEPAWRQAVAVPWAATAATAPNSRP